MHPNTAEDRDTKTMVGMEQSKNLGDQSLVSASTNTNSKFSTDKQVVRYGGVGLNGVGQNQINVGLSQQLPATNSTRKSISDVPQSYLLDSIVKQSQRNTKSI